MLQYNNIALSWWSKEVEQWWEKFTLNTNVSLISAPNPSLLPPHTRSLPSDPYGHEWEEGQGVARKDAPSVRQTWKPAKSTGAGVLKWEGRARQSARGVRKGLHRQTVVYRSVSLSVTPTLGRFVLIAGWGWSSGSTFSDNSHYPI